MLQGKGVAAIDIGARNLIALIGVDSEGNTFSLLFKSGTPRAYWLKCGKLARRRQKIAYKYFWDATEHSENNDEEKEKEFFSKYELYLRKAGRFKRKAREVRKKAVNSMCRLIAEFLVEKGVSTIYVGNSVCYCVCGEDLVEEITSKPARELLRNFFVPPQIINSLRRHCEVKGIQVVEVSERGSSSRCPIFGQSVQRVYRGLIVCKDRGSFNADLAAAYNILRENNSVKLSDNVLKNYLITLRYTFT